MKYLLRILVAAGATLIGAAVHADNYPSKPITLVAVFGPGSASDTICRVIAQPLSVAPPRICRPSLRPASPVTARRRGRRCSFRPRRRMRSSARSAPTPARLSPTRRSTTGWPSPATWRAALRPRHLASFSNLKSPNGVPSSSRSALRSINSSLERLGSQALRPSPGIKRADQADERHRRHDQVSEAAGRRIDEA